MMDITSFTSEPQYQRPDERNDMVHFIPRPVVAQPQPAVVPSPVIAPASNMMYLDPGMARPLFNKFGSGAWIFNRLDFFGNSIILGAICNAIAFIIYGFYRCKVYRVNDTFLWSTILLFGGLGQITAGFLEYYKGRTFPCTLYLCLGFYIVSLIMPITLFLLTSKLIIILQCITLTMTIQCVLFMLDGALLPLLS